MRCGAADMGMDAPVKELPEDDSDQKSTTTALQEIFSTASGYAPGSQKHKAEGTVLRWHKEYGTEEIPVQQYIESLEHEVSLLRREVSPSAALRRPAGPEGRSIQSHHASLSSLAKAS